MRLTGCVSVPAPWPFFMLLSRYPAVSWLSMGSFLRSFGVTLWRSVFLSGTVYVFKYSSIKYSDCFCTKGWVNVFFKNHTLIIIDIIPSCGNHHVCVYINLFCLFFTSYIESIIIKLLYKCTCCGEDSSFIWWGRGGKVRCDLSSSTQSSCVCWMLLRKTKQKPLKLVIWSGLKDLYF